LWVEQTSFLLPLVFPTRCYVKCSALTRALASAVLSGFPPPDRVLLWTAASILRLHWLIERYFAAPDGPLQHHLKGASAGTLKQKSGRLYG
jgi:hypothetical protein